MLHYGHINLLRRAKELGDYLVVVLSTDEFNWNSKQKKCYFTYEERKMVLEAIRYVDLVIPENNWEQKVSDVQEENKRLKPAAEFAYQICSSKDAIDIGNCAKVLNRNIGRNNLFEFLRNKKILQSDNIPYQKYIDSGYFRVIETKYTIPSGETKISLKTLVLQKGVAYINKLLKENDCCKQKSVRRADAGALPFLGKITAISI